MKDIKNKKIYFNQYYDDIEFYPSVEKIIDQLKEENVEPHRLKDSYYYFVENDGQTRHKITFEDFISNGYIEEVQVDDQLLVKVSKERLEKQRQSNKAFEERFGDKCVTGFYYSNKSLDEFKNEVNFELKYKWK